MVPFPGAESGPVARPSGWVARTRSPPRRHHLRPLRRRLCPALHCRVGPSGPTSPGPPAPEERRRSQQSRTRPGREHGVPLSLRSGLTTSIPPPHLGLGRRLARSPPGLLRPTLRFSNRSPSVFGASFLPARSGQGYTTHRPGAAPVPCPPSSNNRPAPSAGGRPPPSASDPAAPPPAAAPCLGDRDGGGGERAEGGLGARTLGGSRTGGRRGPGSGIRYAARGSPTNSPRAEPPPPSFLLPRPQPISGAPLGQLRQSAAPPCASPASQSGPRLPLPVSDQSEPWIGRPNAGGSTRRPGEAGLSPYPMVTRPWSPNPPAATPPREILYRPRPDRHPSTSLFAFTLLPNTHRRKLRAEEHPHPHQRLLPPGQSFGNTSRKSSVDNPLFLQKGPQTPAKGPRLPRSPSRPCLIFPTSLPATSPFLSSKVGPGSAPSEVGGGDNRGNATILPVQPPGTSPCRPPQSLQTACPQIQPPGTRAGHPSRQRNPCGSCRPGEGFPGAWEPAKAPTPATPWRTGSPKGWSSEPSPQQLRQPPAEGLAEYLHRSGAPGQGRRATGSARLRHRSRPAGVRRAPFRARGTANEHCRRAGVERSAARGVSGKEAEGGSRTFRRLRDPIDGQLGPGSQLCRDPSARRQRPSPGPTPRLRPALAAPGVGRGRLSRRGFA
ncbi:basic proline-rich protein-like [Trichechus manatus latirostris]|uniref:Basic proline-rich protein-like n=1 Tax=Trichechus manatus latirostris TaxID=127582 RepID=A0A2Y9G1L8_TRIMA|nr:basic proline-rich protein-like [Trichechus manatus latirostris]